MTEYIRKKISEDIRRAGPGLTVFFLLAVFNMLLFKTVCPFAALTGFPCPGCGLTRAFESLVCGNITQAAEYNAMIFLWIPAVSLLILKRYAGFFRRVPWESVLIPVLLISFGYYVLRLKTGFPFTSPMNYHAENAVAFLLNHSAK